jgi:hypothetical protein
MMVHFCKRISDEDLKRINELVVQRGKYANRGRDECCLRRELTR